MFSCRFSQWKLWLHMQEKIVWSRFQGYQEQQHLNYNNYSNSRLIYLQLVSALLLWQPPWSLLCEIYFAGALTLWNQLHWSFCVHILYGYFSIHHQNTFVVFKALQSCRVRGPTITLHVCIVNRRQHKCNVRECK